MRKLYFAILCCLPTFVLKAQDTLVLQNLKHIWITVDAGGTFSPYTSSNFSELIFFEITGSDQEGDLLIKSEKPVDVWLNNELILFQFASSFVVNLDSLFREKEEGGGLKFKIFSAGGIDESLVTSKILIGDFLEKDLVTINQRARAANDLYIITLSIVLLLMGIFRRFFPVTFSQSVQNPLSLRVRSVGTDRTYDSFGSADNLFSIFFLGSIATLFFTYLGYDLVLFSGKGIFSGLINWLLVSATIVLVITLKYFWTKLISLLYQFREIPNIQTQDFIRFFTLVILLGTGFTLLDFSLFNTSAEWFRDMTVYLVLFALLFFQVWFFRKFDKFYSHKKLMIISYLCTTEFLPGFLAFYWLVKM